MIFLVMLHLKWIRLSIVGGGLVMLHLKWTSLYCNNFMACF